MSANPDNSRTIACVRTDRRFLAQHKCGAGVRGPRNLFSRSGVSDSVPGSGSRQRQGRCNGQRRIRPFHTGTWPQAHAARGAGDGIGCRCSRLASGAAGKGPDRCSRGDVRWNRRYPMSSGLHLRRQSGRWVQSGRRRRGLLWHLRPIRLQPLRGDALRRGNDVLSELWGHMCPGWNTVLGRALPVRNVQPGRLRTWRVLLQRKLQPMRANWAGVHAGALWSAYRRALRLKYLRS
jgi:hypothetical protein